MLWNWKDHVLLGFILFNETWNTIHGQFLYLITLFVIGIYIWSKLNFSLLSQGVISQIFMMDMLNEKLGVNLCLG